jgi:Zn-finger nucleic acid-binding protein
MSEATRQCPIDGKDMRKETVEGVTIDHCPQCHGIWLDRGELDTIKSRIEENAEGDDNFASGFLLGSLF